MALRAMLFPILLIGVSAGIMVACVYWARLDEDDTFRKVVTSVVQIMCLMTMIAGVVRITEHLAKGPTPGEAEAVPPSPSPSVAPPVPGRDPAQTAAARLAAVEAERQRQQAWEADRRFQAENQERLRRIQAQGHADVEPGPSTGPDSTSPPAAEPGPATAPTEPPTDPPPPPPPEGGDTNPGP